MLTQCDAEGNQFLMLDCIIDHHSNDKAMKVANMYVIHNNQHHIRKTTQGWDLCVQWKDGTTTWEWLADLKESNLVEVAEYAVVSSIDNEPAFVWWVPFTLKKQDRIIKVVNNRVLKKTHKFSIEVPTSVEHARRLDEKNGNTYWTDAMEKEIRDVNVAFDVLEAGDGRTVPPGYQKIACHLIFDVKLELKNGHFRCKARYVAGGHMTDAPATVTYASVVSCDSVRIALTLAALNDLQVKSSDVKSAYLTAPVAEKIWTVLGPEFGPDAGKSALIVRALYGLHSAGYSYRLHILECLKNTLGYIPCKADPDVWMKPMIRPEDGFKYWAYILIYTDDCLAIGHDAEGMLKELDQYFKMKEGFIGDPDVYLGAKLQKVTLPNGVSAWALCPSKYVQEAVSNVKKYMLEEMNGRLLPKKVPAPFPRDYGLSLILQRS